MAALNPPFVLQAGSHPADRFRQLVESLVGGREGVVGAGALAVTEKAGTPNMSVDVAAGSAFVDGTLAAAQGVYHVTNDAVTNLTIAAAHATNARKDLVVAKVEDAAYTGATNAWSLAVVTGTPAASPAEPATPANSLVLALVDVPALDTAIGNAQITDRRPRASALGAPIVCTSTTRPASPTEGMVVYEIDTDRIVVYTGAAWVVKLDDSGWQIPTLANGWTQHGSQPLRYRRLNGVVRFKGKIIAGSLALPAFTLPAGYRPSQAEEFIAATNTGGNLVAGNLSIESSGNVIFYASGTTFSAFSGVSFPLEP